MAIKVDSHYRIVIPAEIRKSMNIRPGDLIEIFEINGRFDIVKVIPIQEMRGFAKGIDTTIVRDEDRV